MKSLKDIKRELLDQPGVRAAYEEQADEFNVARELIAARARAGMTQSDVAERMGTTQSVIARLEAGRSAPSLRSVQRYAEAVGARAVVRIEALPKASARRSKGLAAT
ncbi:MAG: helix-turn-helix transcriptional regulator [Inhella sp.]